MLGVAWLRIVSAALVFAVWRRPWRAPLGAVGAIEFAGPVAIAALGARTRRNLLALCLAVIGVYVLTDVRLAAEPVGLVFAFTNCVLFVLYIVLAHRNAQSSGDQAVDRLGAAMLVAAAAITPVGLTGALPTFSNPVLLGAGCGVGVCSSVIPYVCDQLAMARLARATYALLLALLPATAAIMGLIVLEQLPAPAEWAGIGAIVVSVAVHRDPSA